MHALTSSEIVVAYVISYEQLCNSCVQTTKVNACPKHSLQLQCDGIHQEKGTCNWMWLCLRKTRKRRSKSQNLFLCWGEWMYSCTDGFLIFFSLSLYCRCCLSHFRSTSPFSKLLFLPLVHSDIVTRFHVFFMFDSFQQVHFPLNAFLMLDFFFRRKECHILPYFAWPQCNAVH